MGEPAATLSASSGAAMTADLDAWWKHGACTDDADPDGWYPDDEDTLDLWTARVRQVCDGCPVRTRCLTEAIQSGERWGIWGGMSTLERDDLARLHGLGTVTRLRYEPARAGEAAWVDDTADDSRCGSYAGYLAHRYAGDDACDGCRQAKRDYVRSRRAAA